MRLIALGRQPPSPLPLAPNAANPSHAPALRSPARYSWAVQLARIDEIFPRRCAMCRATDDCIIAFITQVHAVNTILRHLGESTSPPEMAPARGPPLWDQAAEPVPDWADSPAPVPAFVFDTSPSSW